MDKMELDDWKTLISNHTVSTMAVGMIQCYVVTIVFEGIVAVMGMS